MDDTRIARIEAMERRLDACAGVVRALTERMSDVDALRDDMAALLRYYGSADWFIDLDADARGELPAGLKRGVLSEDAVYDLIGEIHDAAEKMIRLGAALKDMAGE